MVSRWDVAAAAGELLDRLDDLYDQKPEALASLVATIEGHLPLVEPSALAQLASAARSQLLELDPATIDASELNRRAVAATGDLRPHCAEVWANDATHAAIERQHLRQLKGLLSAGFDVDHPTSDGMTLLHHAIQVEVQSATAANLPVSVEMTSLLVSNGADLEARWRGQTPLDTATTRQHHLAVDVIQAALDGD